MDIVALSSEYVGEVERIATNSWGGSKVVVHHELYDLRELPCHIAVSENLELLGYIYYRFSDNECEIMALESIRHNVGAGTSLINTIKELAIARNCVRLFLQTTNDNTHALRFYQRHGFSICAIRLNELEFSRIAKPSIPLIGNDDIPLMHEIELEMLL